MFVEAGAKDTLLCRDGVQKEMNPRRKRSQLNSSQVAVSSFAVRKTSRLGFRGGFCGNAIPIPISRTADEIRGVYALVVDPPQWNIS